MVFPPAWAPRADTLAAYLPTACAPLLLVPALLIALRLLRALLQAVGVLAVDLPPLQLRGKHVLLTGGSQGLGKALALECAKRGAAVTIMARGAAPLAAAKAELELVCAAAAASSKTVTAKVETAPADVTDAKAVTAAVRAAEGAQGRAVDVLFCVAGMAEPGYFLEQPAELFERQMKLNYLGTVHALLACLPGMVTRNPKNADCRVVLVGSGASAISFLGYAAYAPTKFAVKALAEALRNELCGTCVRVHCAYPPDTATAGFEREQVGKPAENKAMFPLELHAPAAVAALLVRKICRSAPPFHLPSPDPLQNLMLNSVAGVTPRWSTLGDALLAPIAVLLEGAVVLWMDRVAAAYGRRLWSK
ncbi:hypothetical protein T492DRAFT_964241 [Pavlovales sp. CCMP2436]|nr:hypothetical protein T492DRAFT_964241 [Pavlovales sp. CCMP2436]